MPTTGCVVGLGEARSNSSKSNFNYRPSACIPPQNCTDEQYVRQYLRPYLLQSSSFYEKMWVEMREYLSDGAHFGDWTIETCRASLRKVTRKEPSTNARMVATRLP